MNKATNEITQTAMTAPEILGYRKKAIDEINDAISETKKGIDAGE